MVSEIVSLSNLSDDTDINKDAVFIEFMTKVLEIDTRKGFLGYLHKSQNAYNKLEELLKNALKTKLKL